MNSSQRRAALAALIGALAGLLFGVSYWFLWGCTRCARHTNPLTLIAFCVVLSSFLAVRWSKDHDD